MNERKEVSDLVPTKYSNTLGFYCEVNSKDYNFKPMIRPVNITLKACQEDGNSYLLTKDGANWQLQYHDCAGTRPTLKAVDLPRFPDLEQLVSNLSPTEKPQRHEIEVIETIVNQYKAIDLLKTETSSGLSL